MKAFGLVLRPMIKFYFRASLASRRARYLKVYELLYFIISWSKVGRIMMSVVYQSLDIMA